MMGDPNSIKPGRSIRTFEEVSSKIKKMIFEGGMVPGDRLPSEAELANRFHVGRQSVREALRILEFSGYINVRKEGRNSGAVIQNAVLKTITDLFVDACTYETIPWDHLTIARIEIEKRIISYVITNINAHNFESLHENIRQAKSKISLNEPATEENIGFHRLLAQASGNQVFVIVVSVLLAVLGNCLGKLYCDLSNKSDKYGINEGIKRSRKVITYHEDILLAIRQKDQEQAEALMEEHLVDLRDRILSLESNQS